MLKNIYLKNKSAPAECVCARARLRAHTCVHTRAPPSLQTKSCKEEGENNTKQSLNSRYWLSNFHL